MKKWKSSGLLIDKVVKDKVLSSNLTEINGKWYIARPLRGGEKWVLIKGFRKLRACWRVLTDRGFVVYFKEDE